jgi:hypothetical protein
VVDRKLIVDDDKLTHIWDKSYMEYLHLQDDCFDKILHLSDDILVNMKYIIGMIKEEQMKIKGISTS